MQNNWRLSTNKCRKWKCLHMYYFRHTCWEVKNKFETVFQFIRKQMLDKKRRGTKVRGALGANVIFKWMGCTYFVFALQDFEISYTWNMIPHESILYLLNLLLLNLSISRPLLFFQLHMTRWTLAYIDLRKQKH